MLDKTKIFLLNEESKILVFISLGEKSYVPKLVVPSLDMPFFDEEFKQNLENYEYIIEKMEEKQIIECNNNHLQKKFIKKKATYYATTFTLSETMRKNICDFCENRHFTPEFCSVEEIEEMIEYINAIYKAKERSKKLEEGIQVLKRKLNYEEY